MAGLTSYSRALDFVIVAMAKLSEGKPVLAAKLMQKATTCKDYAKTIAALDEMNSKPTLAQALAAVAKAKKAKDKDKDKKKKKKTKASANKGILTIAEVEVDDLGLSEEDLLDSGDSGMLPEVETDEDLDLDDLSLDDDGSDDLELADGDEDLDMDTDEVLLDDDTVLDSDDAISAEAEDTEDSDDSDDDEESDDEEVAEALGTDADIKPGADGTPKATDNGEPSDTVSKDGPPKVSEAARAKRMLANIQVLERQASAIAKASKTSRIRRK